MGQRGNEVGDQARRPGDARLDHCLRPEEFGEYQAADLSSWSGDLGAAEWLKLCARVASLVGPRGPVGFLEAPEPYEAVTDAHLALTSTSWRTSGPTSDSPYPWQIHLILVGKKEALDRVENVIFYFDPAYGANSPGGVDPILKAYVKTSNDRSANFGIYELANGYSVVRAAVKIRNQSRIIQLARLVDNLDAGPKLRDLYMGDSRAAQGTC